MLQHDNAPVHNPMSKSVWFATVGVKDFEWPLQSPDLNPVTFWFNWSPAFLSIAPHPSTLSEHTTIQPCSKIYSQVFFQMSEGDYSVQAELNLKKDVPKAHISVTFRQPPTFG